MNPTLVEFKWFLGALWVAVLAMGGWGWTISVLWRSNNESYYRGRRDAQPAEADLALLVYARLILADARGPAGPADEWFFDEDGVLCRHRHKVFAGTVPKKFPHLTWPQRGWKQ